MRLLAATLFLGLVMLVTGCKSDPATAEYWQGRLEDAKGKKGRLKVVEDLRDSSHAKAMVPVLTAQLGKEKAPEVKEKIALVLGELGDASAVPALMEAIDMAASTPEEKRVNKEIALALGHLGDPKAVPALQKLLQSKDNYTIIASLESLGHLKAKDAFDDVYKFATDETVEPFITKKAIIALGDIGDPRAVPGIVKMMFKERKGISFYMESSFALYQLGEPSADPLVTVLQGKDKELSKWAQENRILPAALTAKAAQVVGDLHVAKAEPIIANMITYKDDMYDIQLFVRMRAADAAGRMRNKAAVKPLVGMLGEEEANALREYVWALTRIGGRDAVSTLVGESAKGSWDRREEAIKGVALLGDERELAAFDKFEKDEPKLTEAECKEDPEYKDCKDVAAGVKKHVDAILKYRKVLEAAKECKEDGACWAKKLDDMEGPIRERAAYEVGRSGDAKLVGELTKRLAEPNLDARLAFIQGCDWLVHDSKDAATAAKAALPALEKQLEDEHGKTQFAKTNEDLRRLAVLIGRS